MSEPRAPDDPEGSTGRIRSMRRRAAELRQRAADLEAQAGERLEREQERRTWVRTLVLAYDADRNRGGNLLAGGLAYRFFLWELPAMLFLVSLFGVVTALSSQDPSDAARSSGMGAAMASLVADAVADAGEARWWLTLVGAFFTLWAGRSAVRGLELAAQIAWQRRQRPSHGVKASLAFSGLVIAAVLLPIAVDAVRPDGAVSAFVGWLFVTIAYTVILVVGMALLPHGGRPWTAILPGALVVVAILRVATFFTTIYLAQRLDGIDDLYGSIGFAIVLLLWLYIIARLYVGANFLNATIAGVSTGSLADTIAGEADTPG